VAALAVVSADSFAVTGKGLGDWSQLSPLGWSLLAGEICLPLATLNWSALQRNLQWMAQFAAQSNALLAPHGKTAMTPELFRAQQAAGAWGMTLATVPQVQSAARAGVRRILLANPLVGRTEQRQVAALIATGLEFYCLIDDAAQLPALQQEMSQAGVRLQLLLELGVAGGRCGVRSGDDAMALAAQIQQFPALRLCGVEFYEGMVNGGAAPVRQFVQQCCDTTRRLLQAGYLSPGGGQPVLLSGAGSTWYDLVAAEFNCSDLSTQGVALVLRPGCYALHDSGIYQDAQQQVLARSAAACLVPGALEDALQLWAYVLSRPEPDLVIVGLGKRDAAFDAGLPQAVLWYRPGMTAPVAVADGLVSVKIMDQHLQLQIPPATDLAVGDMLAFSASHPCLTLDKWRQLAVLDADFVVRRVLATEF
jgi:D-serine dehydratase